MKKKEPATTFSAARREVLIILEDLGDVSASVSSDSRSAIEDLVRTTKAPLFTIAVTGPSRVGKSTLINSLLGQGLAPVGDWPTTGAPCTFVPSDKSGLEITHLNGQQTETELTPENLKAWVTQDSLEGRGPDAQQVVARVSASLLDLGVAIVDLPGLDDANELVRNTAGIALEACDAVIYVMDAGDAAEGKFNLTGKTVEELQALLPQKDKTLIVLNKSDRLSPDKRTELLKYLRAQFKKYNLLDLDRNPPFWVSAKTAFAKRCENDSNADDSEFRQFEDGLFDYLLSKGELGRNRLASVLAEAATIVGTQVSIANLSIEHSEKVASLKKHLASFDRLEGRVTSEVPEIIGRVSAQVRAAVFHQSSMGVSRLHQQLSDIPVNVSLPSREDLKRALEAEIGRMVSQAKGTAQYSLEEQTRPLLGAVNEVFFSLAAEIQALFSNIGAVSIDSSLGAAASLNLWSPFIGTVGLGLIGLAFGPIGALIGGLIGLFLGFFVGEQERRAREISQATLKSEQILNDAAQKIMSYMDPAIERAARQMQAQLLARIRSTRDSLQSQISTAGSELTPVRHKALTESVSRMAALAKRVDGLLKMLG